ncbi:amidase [Ornithinimicrobium sp. Y1847]|uniref:amidase n=1 Tax=Ornithinimicrobium sp. Y1847 TaxID=3405419 RepID=UPI003B677333
MSLADLTATELTARYAAGHLSPVDVAEAVLARVDDREPDLNAFYLRDDSELVLERAAASTRRWEAGEPLSVLDGVPVTVKENIARAGVPMPAGCAGVEPVVPEADSPIARRVVEAGMLVLGSTVMPDWGMLSSGHSSLHGQTFSPLNPAWGTGGSSSGAGVAAAAGYGPLHVGTDIGGSIRLPGTWLGLSTLKPSAGRIPLHAPYLGRVAGPMARTAADCALLMSVLAGPDPADWTSLPGDDSSWELGEDNLTTAKVGVWTEPGYGMDPALEVVAAVETAADRLSDAGAHIIEIKPWLGQDLLDGIDRFWRIRSLADFERLSPAAQAKVLPYIQAWVTSARGLSAVDALDAYAAFAQVQSRTVAAWARAAPGGLDLMISPVAPEAAPAADLPMPYPEQGRGMWHINFTMPWNMTGQAAGTAPVASMSDGRPIGVQVIGRAFDDLAVLRTMRWLESA